MGGDWKNGPLSGQPIAGLYLDDGLDGYFWITQMQE
jgi:hypothetical protein